MQKLMVTMAEAAAMVGLSRATVYARADYPSVKVGRSRRVRVDDLERWVAEQEPKQTIGPTSGAAHDGDARDA